MNEFAPAPAWRSMPSLRAGLRVAITSGDSKAKVGICCDQSRYRDVGSPAVTLLTSSSGSHRCAKRGARVIVVGDGVNDAPMLAAADVAVAVGSAVDAAQAASDAVITARLGVLAEARVLAAEMLSILQQNRRWALGYNLATVPLAALGFVPPWLAALGMSASSLAVVLNALRIGGTERKANREGATGPDVTRPRSPAHS